MSDALYVLTRTAGRPQFFARARESVRALDWPRVVHVVHTDDPRDSYVDGDIVVRAECHSPNTGTAPYNLYNNTLLKIVPKNAWVAFLDDDDEYASADVFSRILDGADHGTIHTGMAYRGVWSDGEGKTWNATPHAKQKQYQTECVVMRGDIAKKASWWGYKGGDHYYTRQLVKRYPTQWHDVLIAQAQAGKGSGKRVDIDGEEKRGSLNASQDVWFKHFVKQKKGRQVGKLEKLPYREAEILERHGYGRVTYKGIEICDYTGAA